MREVSVAGDSVLHKTFDFWHSLDNLDRQKILFLMLPDVAAHVEGYSYRSFNGLLLVASAPGTGKRTFVC